MIRMLDSEDKKSRLSSYVNTQILTTNKYNHIYTIQSDITDKRVYMQGDYIYIYIYILYVIVHVRDICLG